MTCTEQALRVAFRAHATQTRKTDGSPYVFHPMMVAILLARHGFSDEVCAAALVHDVLEDTAIREDELRMLVGECVCAIVRDVTEDTSLAWEERKHAYLEAVRRGSVDVKAVSIADKIHNAESLIDAYAERGSAVWGSFNRGKDQKLAFEEALLAMFRDTWTHPLVDVYAELVSRMHSLT